METSPLLTQWATILKHSSAHSLNARPNYYHQDPSTLASSSDVVSFQTGTGDDIFQSILPSLESAQSEILFITCFWAKSSSLDRLCLSLCALSDRVVRERQPRIRVRIGLSSLSLFQKLFQTSHLAGREYAPNEWTAKLGLPPPERLQGLDLRIKSVFVRPFSVMHPKFIVIDREHVWLPSCNVSWEEWFEGCVELRGSIVLQFVRFWKQFWRDLDDDQTFEPQLGAVISRAHHSTSPSMAGQSIAFARLGSDTFTVFLPSPHHINPRFRPFPWQDAAHAPPTPLNIFILRLLASAGRSIYIQTPNLTCPPVLTALLKALKRGVDVRIITSERLMILEQLVTAGTTTSRCVKQLIRRYNRLSKRRSADSHDYEDLEQQDVAPGQLRIDFYRPRTLDQRGEPVQSHLKLTAVDDEWLVLGSGNMDRASWYTSQELGVAFFNKDVTLKVTHMLESTLQFRKKGVFP